MDNVNLHIEIKPWQAVLILLGVGFILGILFFSSVSKAQALDGAVQLHQLVQTATESEQRADSMASSGVAMIPFERDILRAARKHNLPPALLAAFIQEESGFNPWAERSEPGYLRNRKIKTFAKQWSKAHHGIPTELTEQNARSRSMGLMQPMGELAREQGYDSALGSLFAPFNSIDQGATLLRKLIARYGTDTLSAISAYNQGNNRKTHGTFDNARYVYRVSTAWKHYDRVFTRLAMAEARKDKSYDEQSWKDRIRDPHAIRFAVDSESGTGDLAETAGDLPRQDRDGHDPRHVSDTSYPTLGTGNTPRGDALRLAAAGLFALTIFGSLFGFSLYARHVANSARQSASMLRPGAGSLSISTRTRAASPDYH